MIDAILGLGLHDLAPDAYHRDPAPEPSLSSTLARVLLDQSPLHAWIASPRLNPAWEPNDRKVFDLGRAIHRAVLGKGADYAPYPDDVLASNGAASTREAKEWAEGMRAAGRTPLKPDEFDMVNEVAGRVSERLASMGMAIRAKETEVTALAEVDDVWCRAMVDFAPKGRPWLMDLKSTTDASPEACIRAVTTYGLDVQAAHYLAVWEAATGERRRFRFAFCEKAPPHEVSVVELHDEAGDEADWMEDARGKAAWARQAWGDCLRDNSWPGYPARVAIVGAPGFYRHRWAEKGAGAWEPAPKPDADTLARAHAWQAP